MAKAPTFEQALKALEESVAKLEKGQLPLDESLACFEAGVQNALACRKLLQEVEGRVELLLKDADGTFRTEPFERIDETVEE